MLHTRASPLRFLDNHYPIFFEWKVVMKDSNAPHMIPSLWVHMNAWRLLPRPILVAR